MIPTLFIGDFILVNKFAYGLRLPITNQKIVATGEPKRGDVVVFRPPQHPDEDWIKRVMGVPGDTVAYRDDTVYINGKPLQYVPRGRFVGTGQDQEATGASTSR
jgi:signal peptidase I